MPKDTVIIVCYDTEYNYSAPAIRFLYNSNKKILKLISDNE